MKELIKHILNEEVSKQQIDKGIDIVVNGLKKEFSICCWLEIT